MNNPNRLNLEQEFKLTMYRQKVYKLKKINVKKHLMASLKQMMIKDNIIKYFIKNNMP